VIGAARALFLYNMAAPTPNGDGESRNEGNSKLDRKLTLALSGTLVTAMFAHAWHIAAHGAAPSEIHLITSAPVAVAVSSSISAVDYVHHNAITEAVHPASAPREDQLRLGGLTAPSS